MGGNGEQKDFCVRNMFLLLIVSKLYFSFSALYFSFSLYLSCTLFVSSQKFMSDCTFILYDDADCIM